MSVGPYPSAVGQPRLSVPAAQQSGSPRGYSSSAEMERSIARRSDIDKTKTGLLVAIVGVILGAVSFIPYIGLVLVIIGMILVLLGADSFGGSHTGYAKGSLVLVILGNIIGYGISVAAASSLDQVPAVGSQALRVTSIFDGVLAGLVIIGIVLGVAYVLLTFDLQERSGRLELYAAFVSQMLVGILVAVVFSGAVAAASGPAGGFEISQIKSLQTELQYLQLAGLIPAGLFADAFYRIYSRINNGYLPERPRPLTSNSPKYMRT